MLSPLLPPKLASSAMAPSTSCLSAPFPHQRLRPQMSWISICIAARLRPCWQMKTTSKIRIDGTLIPPVVRSSPRSLPNGSGTYGWSWGNSSPHPSCARPSLLLHVRLKLPRPASLNQRNRPCLRLSMVLPNGHGVPLPTAFLAPRLLCNRMGLYAALPTARSIPRSGVPSVMAHYGSCMPHASAIVVPAPCVRSARKVVPRRNHDG